MSRYSSIAIEYSYCIECFPVPNLLSHLAALQDQAHIIAKRRSSYLVVHFY